MDEEKEFEEKAIPLITEGFDLENEGIEFLQKLSDKNISVISVIGPAASGKSFLANQLSGKINKGFEIGSIENRNECCTKGIWIWGKPIIKDNFYIIILDAQGFRTDTDENLEYSQKIFALCSLISSVVIYNYKKDDNSEETDKISNEVLQHSYELFNKLITFMEKIKLEDNEELSEDKNKLTPTHIPEFIWLYRDYTINVFHPKNSSYEISHTLKSHKGEITSLLYIDNYLISGSKDRTLRIWNFDATDKIYKIAQVIRLDKEIKKINKYIFESYIGFLVSGEENNFRLFLKKENIDEEKNAMEIEKKNEDNGKEEKDDKWGDDDGKDDNGVKTEEIFKIEQVLSDHDNEVCEAIQIANNNDIVSGSKDMTIIVWKDCTNSLQYECSQIISAGNEVEALCLFGNKGFAAAVSGSYEIKLYELNNAEGKYENICSLSVDFCHDRSINQIILLKDNRIASCSYDSTVKILSYNSLTNELREDQELDEQNLSVNGIIETANGKLITGGHGKHLMIYKRN